MVISRVVCERKGGIAAPEISTVLLQMGSAEKGFLDTYMNAYLKKSISVQLYASFITFSSL